MWLLASAPFLFTTFARSLGNEHLIIAYEASFLYLGPHLHQSSAPGAPGFIVQYTTLSMNRAIREYIALARVAASPVSLDLPPRMVSNSPSSCCPPAAAPCLRHDVEPRHNRGWNLTQTQFAAFHPAAQVVDSTSEKRFVVENVQTAILPALQVSRSNEHF